MEYTLEFFDDFHDGNIYHRMIRRGEILKVGEPIYLKIKQSAPTAFTVRQKHIPLPKVTCPKCLAVYPREEEHICETND